MTKDTNFKFRTHAPGNFDVTHENNSRKRGWPGSRDAILGGDMHPNEQRHLYISVIDYAF